MSEMDQLAVEIFDIMKAHIPTSGMAVTNGTTCKCGYWTGNERAGYTRPVGFVDPLDWHRASVIASHVRGEVEKP